MESQHGSPKTCIHFGVSINMISVWNRQEETSKVWPSDSFQYVKQKGSVQAAYVIGYVRYLIRF